MPDNNQPTGVIPLWNWCFCAAAVPDAHYVPPGRGWVHARDSSGHFRFYEPRGPALTNERRFEAADGITYELEGPPTAGYLVKFIRPMRIWFLPNDPFHYEQLGWFKWQVARLCAWVVHLGMGIH